MKRDIRKHQCLAYIWPLEPYQGKDTALSAIKIMTKPFKRKIIQTYVKTSIYNYYFHGVTFESITIDDDMNVLDIRDVNADDYGKFDISVIHALSFDCQTHDLLGSNGFLYNLDQSVFYRHCEDVCKYLYKEIETAYNFTMQMYTLDGGIIAVLFEKNVKPEDKRYNIAIHKGFITQNKDILRSIVPVSTSIDKKRLLKQSEIDEIIESYYYNRDV